MHSIAASIRSKLTLTALAVLGSVMPALGQATDIGSRLELFVDKQLIERLDGVELKLREPVKLPLAKSPLPVRHMKTIIKDGDLYRAWYRDTDKSFPPPLSTGHDAYHTCYAESVDGNEWTFPKLGLFDVEGSRDNNAVLAHNPPFGENLSPFLDTRPGVDPKERYKAIAGYPGSGDKRTTGAPGKGLYGFVSPDGIHWTRNPDEAIPYKLGWRHAFDSQNVAFWSAAEGQYICFFRTWTDPERLRSVSRSTSKDFKTWSEPVELNPNLPGEHLYTTQTHPYFRAPHIYIAMPTRFVPGRNDAVEFDVKNPKVKDANVTDVMFMTMRAGATKYDRLFPEAFIRPGLDPSTWTNRANYVALSVVPTGPDEMSIYHRNGHRYVLRTDGFVSATAGAKTGELLTKPIVFTGGRLTLNYSTTARGGIRVEVQDESGNPIPGFSLAECLEIIGDKIERDVAWTGGGTLASLAGKPVRLRFVMTETDLYSYRFQ
jgi:hypothetical protein